VDAVYSLFISEFSPQLLLLWAADGRAKQIDAGAMPRLVTTDSVCPIT